MAKISPDRKCLQVIVLTLVLAFFCRAGMAAAEQKVYRLDQLIEMAVATDPELKMAEQDVLVARSEFSQAKAGMLPQLDLNAIIGPVDEAREPVVLVNAQNVGVLADRDSDTVTVFGRLDFAITQPLYTFGKISNRKDAAALGVEAQLAAKEKKRNEVALHVKELYYAYLVAGQGKKAAGEADDFIQNAGKRIKRLIAMKAKNADQSDLYRLDAFSAEVKAFAAKAEAGAKLSYQALKKAAGLRDDEDFRLDAVELPKKPLQLGPEGEYVLLALANRPEFIQTKKGAEARKKLMEAAQADLYPSFYAAVIGSVAGSPGRDRMDISYIPDQFNHEYAGVVAGAQWHFDLGIGKGKVDKAKAEYDRTRHAQDFAARNIPLEVMKYYQDAIESETSYKAFEQAAVGSRRWIVTAFANFDMGTGTARDMFDAIDRYGKNQGEYLRSLYGYHVALARLDYAIGRRGDAY
ncbi:MAG: TolC family protein [Syntrophobacteraceae bacterium]